MKSKWIVLALAAAALAAPAQAQLFAGTSLNPTGGNHNVYLIDLTNGMAFPAGPIPIWGATYDVENFRVLYTTSVGSTNGDQLWEWPTDQDMPNLLGTITEGGLAQRIDGLAMSGGVLYGSYAGGTAEDGLWTIDLNTLVGTNVFAFADSVSGIDADPDTGVIYGVDDTLGQIVTIDPVGQTITPVAAYPIGQTDIDGVAVGYGKVFLVPDEPGSIHVYDIATATYDPPIPNPWTSADTFSGAAVLVNPIFTDGFESGDAGRWTFSTP